ncbi:MAG: nucleotide exchange factor GrpE [Patescibacteria group bacterium]
MPKVSKIENRKSEIDKKVVELTADLQRLQADFINFKVRAERERLDALRLGREMAVSELLPVFDNLERAFAHTPKELQDNNWVKGINVLEKQLLDVLSNLGLHKIETVGKIFDPSLMEAVSVEDGPGEEVVAEEMQSGYMLGDKILRPAIVKVKK